MVLDHILAVTRHTATSASKTALYMGFSGTDIGVTGIRKIDFADVSPPRPPQDLPVRFHLTNRTTREQRMKLPKIGLLAIGIALILVAMGCSEGLYEHALEEYDKAIELDPTDTVAYYDRAIGYRYLGENQLALKDLDKALDLDPKFARAYTDRGIIRSGLGQYHEGIQDYDRAIALDPVDAKAYYNRGIAYGKLDKYDKTKADKAKACSLDSQYC